MFLNVTSTNQKIAKQNNWNEDEMIKIWLDFAEIMKKSKKINAYNIFNRSQPKKVDSNNELFLQN